MNSSAQLQRHASGRARRQAGVTIVELTTSVVIAILIGGAILMVFATLIRSLSTVMSKVAVTSQLRNAVDQIGRDVEIAKARQLTPCGASYTPSDVVLILQVPSGTLGSGIERVIYQCAPATADCPGDCTGGSPGCLERVLEDAACANPPARHTVARNVILWMGAAGVAWPVNGADFFHTTYGPPNTQTVVTRLMVQSTIGGVTTNGKLVVLDRMRNI